MIRVTHVITGLETGGAETALVRLLAATPRGRFESSVFSLSGEGALSPRLRAIGVPLLDHGLKGRQLVRPVAALTTALWRTRPDIVQTWLYRADLLAGVVARAVGVRQVVWGLRGADLDPHSERRATFAAVRASARLSRHVPARIICNSIAAREAHVRIGYDASRMVVIPNGLDVVAVTDEDRRRARADLGIEPDAVVVGRVGRYVPVKDYPTFLEALGRVARTNDRVIGVLCGLDVDARNHELMSHVRAAGLDGRVRLLGLRDDMHRVYPAFDVACSSSYTEGFPNVVAEAMAYGVVVAATDVGDSAEIVGDTGLIVPARDPNALRQALDRLTSASRDERCRLGAHAQDRIATTFGAGIMAARYAECYEELLGHVRH